MMLAWLVALAALGLSPSEVAASYSMWHAVDAMSVVCPVIPPPANLPPNISRAEWPSKQEFVVLIEPDHGMLVDRPHIVTFMRTSTKAVTITFELKDADGRVMVPTERVTLQATAANTPSGDRCKCTGLNTNLDTSVYGADYGKTCASHDASKCSEFWPGLESPEVCCKAWCYVPGDCPSAFKSEAASDLYWSYDGVDVVERCADMTMPPACTAKHPAKSFCVCKNVDATIAASPYAANFSAGYGAVCRTWDYDDCGERYAPNIIDTWCCEGWCWTDEACESSIASKVWPGLFWTSRHCEDDEAKLRNCPYKAQADPDVVANDTACECIGYSPSLLRSGRRRTGMRGPGKMFSDDYGKVCGSWDKDDCGEYFPNESTDMWCCQSWCYVDEDCPSSRPSWTMPGYHFSYDACQDDGETLRTCAYSEDCRPSGNNTGLSSANLATFGNDYGTACQAWDATNCPTFYPNANLSDWCCDAWAYVNRTCPLAKDSSFSVDLFWSDDICTDPAANTWNAGSNSCVSSRRLGSPPAVARRLSARRRRVGGQFMSSARRRSTPSASSSWSPRRRWSSPRRRAPVSASSARRRQPPPPPPAPPRRRVQTLSPRRRAAPESSHRRRTTPTPAPAPPSTQISAQSTHRRRSPGAADASPRRRVELTRRRRTIDQSPSAARRRMSIYNQEHTSVSPAYSANRRRAPYGYTNQNQVMQNYGGGVPNQVNYGYSGMVNQGKQNSNIKLAMGAAAGLAAGAVIGAGGYYAYKRYSEGNWGGNYGDRSWCGHNGNTMRCHDCVQRYGSNACQNQNNCYSEAGCNYQVKKPATRDDLIKAGFTPEGYAAPFHLTVTGIEGADFTPDKICPKEQPDSVLHQNWETASSFGIELFVTVTEMGRLGPESDDQTNLVNASYDGGIPVATLMLCLLAPYFMRRR